MYDGGCLCGALRFSVKVRPINSGYCHCTLCQRSTGAPVLAWAMFSVDAFTYTKGRATHYQSSSWGHREFCNQCGTQIGFRETDAATTIEVNVGCMDNPSEFPPEYHIYANDRSSWFDTADDLPRHPGSEPGSD